MKGWRPSAIRRLETGSGYFQAGVFLPGVGSIGLSFPPVPVPGIIAPGTVDAGFPPVREMRLTAAQSGERRPSVRDLKNGASPSLAS